MNKSLGLIGRCAVITFGYGCAILAAGFLLNILILATIGALPDFVDDGFVFGFWPGLLIATPFMGLVIGYFAFWPALGLIILGEYFNKRDSLFYAIGGLIIGLLLFFAGFQTDIQHGDEVIIIASMAAAGTCGGFIYWLVAGRWSNRPIKAAEPQD